MSDLEDLARKGRAKPSRADTKRAAHSPPGPGKEELKRTRRAFASGGIPWLVWAMFGLPVLMMVIGLVVHYVAGLPGDPGLTAISLGVLAVALHFAVVQPLTLRRERRWMERLPYRFDTDGYSRQLGKARQRTRIRIVLRFEAPIPSDASSLVRDAAEGVHADARANIDDDGALTISTEMPTYRSRYDDSGDGYDNGGVHEFVRTVLRKGVVPIDASHSVEQVTVHLSEVG